MENDVIKFRFAGIEIVSKSINPAPLKGVGLEFLFDLQFEIRVVAEHKLVIPVVTIKVRGGEIPEELANIVVSSFFEVEDFENVIKINDHGLHVIPPSLDATIRPVAISTTRGVMYSEFRGTYLNNAILPVIYMTQLKSKEP